MISLIKFFFYYNKSINSNNDGINFPISIRQTIATSNSGTPSNQFDSLLLNDNNEYAKNNESSNSSQDNIDQRNGQVRIHME